jgi:hypothetical protein
MTPAVATVSVTNILNLPSLAVVLNLPATIGGVATGTLASVFSRAATDIQRLIIDVQAHHWRDAAELTVDDGLYIAGLAGVPGASIAATLVPYIFDLANAEIDGRGHVSVAQFVKQIAYAQTNLGAIFADIRKRDWSDATHLELDDLADVASAFGAGPAAAIAKAAVNIGFAIGKSGGDPAAFRAIFAGLEQMFKDAAHLPSVVINEINGQYERDATGKWEYNPFRGWVLVAAQH